MFLWKINRRLLHTAQCHFVRGKDPGVAKRIQIFEDDREFQKSLDDEEDFGDLESDFNSTSATYNDHKSQIRRQQHWKEKKMTVQKFFREPKQPHLLTWVERQKIRKLHEEDPEEWSIDALADSFPATRDTIVKILKAKWQPEEMEKMKRKDEVVRRNWELLAQGKLEVEPELEKHLKKFLPRREEYLESLAADKTEFLLEKPKPKPVWNCGQMSNILGKYEEELAKLEQKERNPDEQPLISSATDRDVVEDRLKFEIEQKKPVDYFKIGGESNFKENDVTLEKLKTNLGKQEGRGRSLSAVENVMFNKSKKNKMTINERLSILAGYNITTDVKVLDEKGQLIKEDIRDQQNDVEKAIQEEISDEKDNSIKVKQIESEISHKDTISSAIKVEKTIAENTDSSFSIKSEDTISVASQNVEDVSPHSYKFSSDRDLEDFHKEESSIKDTFFWPETREEAQDVVVRVEASTEKLLKKDYEYPERIEIPKEKRGSGLTFRVSDCFYDDDGQFLYRVPGMLKIPVPEGADQ